MPTHIPSILIANALYDQATTLANRSAMLLSSAYQSRIDPEDLLALPCAALADDLQAFCKTCSLFGFGADVVALRMFRLREQVLLMESRLAALATVVSNLQSGVDEFIEMQD